MPKAELNLTEMRSMFIYAAAGLEARKDLLTEADRAIGDGDHGVGMARGFAAVHQRLEGHAFPGVGEMLDAIGMTLLTNVGGAAGAIFGTFFRAGAKSLTGVKVFDSAALAQMLTLGLEAVQSRGGANPGDKTVVDALEPAARRANELKEVSLATAFTEVSEQARRGMESTKDMLPRVGKAKPLGARALGHADPGALSMYLLLKHMAGYVVGEKELS
jgi:dihydroxyacetone kinase-like protein